MREIVARRMQVHLRRRNKEKLIILLDEPGLGLHAAAQNDLLRYIDERLAPTHQVVPVGGIDKIPTFIALLGAHLPNVTVLQEISATPAQRVESLIERQIIARSNVIPLTTFTGGTEADLEDLFDEAFYLELMKASGTAKVAKTKLPPGRRIVKRIEDALGGPFDHFRPARHLLEHPDLLGKVDAGTLDRFEKLFTEANARLAA